MLSEFCSRSYFFPTIQLRPAAGARTLLHIGTHRREYSDLDPNHLYYMQWRLKGLERCPFVEDVTLADNVFDNDLCVPGRAAITIYVDGESGRIRRHRNIRLKGNQFLHCAKIVEASQVEHLTIEP